ncbi:O-antigen ligase-like membrane protein [Flavobacterium sp. 103]|uniref:O-antigen ligase family protein n=1 Tax=Flavobacterium sp. 103 TaxID=2135624 RepID=UPI000D5E31B7|nr:O-antigen ligase family protein [Flavobacterium sp. 103]PVX47013.1 O-antigen ligase-like membrane protein [Flavobacterium sp. 103]
MTYLKIVILTLLFCNLPSFSLVHLDATTGAFLSYGTFFLIIIYFLHKKEMPIVPLVILGLSYFLISILIDSQNSDGFVATFVKYLIFVTMGASVIKDVTKNEIFTLLLIGALSIIYESIFVIDIGGRYSGFYLNPNFAGCICILGYCFSFSISDKKIKIIGQILFSYAGFVTFSRTFLLLWVLVNILSLSISYKNSYKIILGIVLISFFVSFGNKFDFNTKRLEAFATILDGKISQDLAENSRTLTWAKYYDRILDHPFFGNGYLSFSGKTYGEDDKAYGIEGVHNTPLLIIGEAGIFVFLYFLWLYGGFVLSGIHYFKQDFLLLLVSFSLFIYMLTTHNFFNNYILLSISIWLFQQIEIKKTEEYTCLETLLH